MESRAPHHVGDVHRTAVLDFRQPALDTGDPRNSFHPEGNEVFGLDADQRFAGGEPLGASLPADRSPGCQHAVKDDPTDERHQDAPGDALGDGKGISPFPAPESNTLCVLTSSMATSPPELPAPTTKTSPSWSCPGFLYSAT